MMVPLLGSPGFSQVPIVFSSHNVETDLSTQLNRNAGLHLRLLAGVDEKRTFAVERAGLALSQRTIVVSESDRRCFVRSFGCDPERCVVVPNCCASSITCQKTARGAEVLFVGTMGWRPNVDGLRWFLDGVLERLRQLIPDVSVHVAGSKVPRWLRRRLRAAGCWVSEDVVDLNPLYARARVAIVPLRLGGGTRIKITEAWRAGVPVVSTSLGAHGLLDDDPGGVLVANTASDFATAIAKVIADDETYLALRREGLKRSTQHEWMNWAPTLRRLYAEITAH